MKTRFWILLSFVTLMILVLKYPTATTAVTTASVEYIGTRLLRDADFYGNRDWTNNKELERQDTGGRVQVYIHNTGTEPLTVTGFTLGGKSFEQLTTETTSRVNDTKWWRMWPNPIEAGKTAMLNMRLVDLTADLPADATLVLQTNNGDIPLPGFDPAPTDLWISSLNFTEDLHQIILFVGNRGVREITLKATGGLSINGAAELLTGTVTDMNITPGEVVPVVVEVAEGTLITGTQTVFQITADSGETAFGSVRVFPYEFTMMAHMQGSNYDAADRAAHYIDDWKWWTPEILDEPHGHSIAPMEVVQQVDNWLNDPAHPERAMNNPSTIHNTSYLEGLIYDDIADIANSHWGNIRQDLAAYVTQPKANWYMPQNSWGHNEGLYRRESWSALEDLQFQAFQATGRGAKAIQWFLHQNHWRQGWGRMEGTDFARTYQDKYRTGHISNPLTWNRIGRVSGALHIIEPYLTYSTHAGEILSDGIQVDVLISVPMGETKSGSRAIITIMDYATPRSEHAGYAFRYNVPTYDQQRRYNIPIRISLPDYIYNTVSHAYIIDPWLGIQEIPFIVSAPPMNGSRWEGVITLPELNVGALVLLGDTSDGAQLKTRWAEVAPHFAAYDDVQPAVLSQSREHANTPWYAPDTVYRQTVTITNTGNSPANTFALPLELPQERVFNQDSYRVYEVAGDIATEVPFYAAGAEVYADFTNPENYPRMKWGGQGGADASWFTVTQTVTGVHLLSKKLVSSPMYAWGASFWEDQGPLPWMDGHNSYWIPAHYNALWIDIKPTGFPFGYYNYKLTIYWDKNEDGIIDKSRSFTFTPEGLPNGEWSNWVWYDLGNGWRRYVFNMDAIFNLFFPGEKLRGQYRPGYQTIVPADYEHLINPDTYWPWSIRQVKAIGGKEVLVKPTPPLAVGESRTYEVYLDVIENGPDTPSTQVDPTLTTVDLAADITATTGKLEIAGVDVITNNTSFTITPQAENNGIKIHRIDNTGELVETLDLTKTLGLTEELALTPLPQPGELLAITPVQLGHEGETFVFNANGHPVTGQVPMAVVIPEIWRAVLEAGQSEITRTIPYAMGLSPDGQYIAVGTSVVTYDVNTGGSPPMSNVGRVWLFNAAGKQVWEKTFPGRPFYIRFTPDSQSLYIAANLSNDGIQHSGDWNFPLYENSHILKYNLAGVEQWRHKIGEGVGKIPAAEQGRTIFDMQVYAGGSASGDVLYSEWHTYGVRLDSSTGDVVWAQDTGFGTTTYTPRVVPLDNGGGVLLGFYSRRVDASGEVVASVFMSNENHHALGASANGDIWALSGNSVRVITQTDEFRITPGGPQTYIGPGTTVGRYPRIIRVNNAGTYIAAGSSDGVFALLDNAGNILWEKRDSTSYVTDIHFLPGDTGVAFMREIFNYSHTNNAEVYGWRWRDVVEAYDFDGTPLWRHEGRWREEEPGMGQFALDDGGTRMAVLTNGDIRYINLTAEPVNNSHLYPVDDYGDAELTPFTLHITPESQAIAPGGTARYQIKLDSPMTYPITLTVTNPAPDTLEITPQGNTIVIPNQLIVSDINTRTMSVPARTYTIPITAAGGGYIRTAEAKLLVGGRQIYLPLVVKQ